MSKINCLSPYYLTYDVVRSNVEIELRIFIYTGEQTTDRPTEATYTLKSTPVNGSVSFEVSDLIKDYFNVNELDTKSMWMDALLYEYDGSAYYFERSWDRECFYGYSYFVEGANSENIIDATKPYENLVTYSADFSVDDWVVGSNLTISNAPSGDSSNRDCNFVVDALTDIELDYDIKLQAGSTFTISYYILPELGQLGNRYFFVGYLNGSTVLSSSSTTIDFSLNEFQYVSHTFTVPEGFHTNTKIRLIDNGASSLGVGDEFRIWNVCVSSDSNLGKRMVLTEGGRQGFERKRNVKLSTDYLYSVGNKWASLPVIANDGNDFATNVKAYSNGVEISGTTTVIGTSTNTSSCVSYIQIPIIADTINVQYGVNASDLYLHNEYNIKAINICETKYNPYRVRFINKYGVNEDIWFIKNSKLELSIEDEGFKRNIVNNGSYSTYDHQYHTLRKQGRETITLNSGFYPEDYNEAFVQLLQSEYVWLFYKDRYLPVKIKDSSFTYKTRLTDRVINYTMQFEFAFDKLNNVR